MPAMTKAQELQVRELEIREAINKLLGTPDADRPDDYAAQLDVQTAAMAKLTPELRAALAAEPEPEIRLVPAGDAETRERRSILGKTGLADFLAAAAGGRAVSGAAAEYAAACGTADTGRIPLAIFRDRAPETRAITPGPAVDAPPQPTVPYVFERSAAMALGVMMPTVPPGQVQIPRVSTAPPADTLAKAPHGVIPAHPRYARPGGRFPPTWFRCPERRRELRQSSPRCRPRPAVSRDPRVRLHGTHRRRARGASCRRRGDPGGDRGCRVVRRLVGTRAVVRQANWRRTAGESPAEGRNNQPPSPRVMRRSL